MHVAIVIAAAIAAWFALALVAGVIIGKAIKGPGERRP